MSDAENSRNNAATARARKSRAVSDLSLQQIEHKRDLDRRAQRALRQRTKGRIQELEEALSQAQTARAAHDHSLETELRRLREENHHLKARLNSIARYARHGACGGTDVGADIDIEIGISAGEMIRRRSPAAATPSPLEVHLSTEEQRGERQRGAVQRDTTLRQAPEPNLTDTMISQGRISREPSISTSTQGELPQPAHAEDFRDGQERVRRYDPITDSYPLGQPSDPGYSTVNHVSPPDNSAQPSSVSTGYHHLIASPGDAGSFGYQSQVSTTPHPGEIPRPSVPSAQSQSPALTSGGSERIPSPTPSSQVSRMSSISSVLPKHTASTCPLDHILLDFLAARRAMQKAGTAAEILAGPERVSVQAMLRPEQASAVHPVSRVMAEVLLTFSHVSLPEKVAFMYLMHCTMRWQISPTKESYALLPQWLRPTAAQIAVPHAAWIDNIPWPRVRDMLIEYPEKYPFEAFSSVYSQSVTVNWPYDTSDVVSQVGDETLLNLIFEKHVRMLSNWTVGPHFREFYPEMVDHVYRRD
ncbi:hypothetical protein QBC33DRAFT_548450 [Phialemonium atrogriseum]|uniref:BZIP domain-containing protein n=1 Tax=Phialemonium atrogriseum TaxID=1093897 RepID=A0AAJ0BXQ0_9PEZI|nr:uncharacterized protein QBC33DRAFT_548450 [Phialemonium atrogriseum]KAK1763971.1 hypothetical protein QBC33DRAFT_548450 [Phialemonium atrogriseum]